MKYEVYLKTAIKAGMAILDIYNDENFEIHLKDDNSPLTTADIASNSIINEDLKELNLPILSEENKAIPYSERKSWKEFILVDPLDGTKEFIKRNGEFTVNIAIIRENYPVFGVIYAPVPDVLYWGAEDSGSWKMDRVSEILEAELFTAGIATRLPDKSLSKKNDKIRIVASKSHFSDETKKYIENITDSGKDIELVSRGSSLKFCLLAEGSAELYPRLGPTMEWDTAAGHAIAKYAGYSVLRFDNKEELGYNKEDLLNPWFVVGREII